MEFENKRDVIKQDLPRIADALYQDHPNAREVVRRYFEELITYTQLMEERAGDIADYETRYPAWGRALEMLLEAYEADDRVLEADVITYELLPLM